jgi:hypothetical protein
MPDNKKLADKAAYIDTSITGRTPQDAALVLFSLVAELPPEERVKWLEIYAECCAAVRHFPK